MWVFLVASDGHLLDGTVVQRCGELASHLTRVSHHPVMLEGDGLTKIHGFKSVFL